jgi:mono/diheme cytochrome c family protein
VLNLTAGGTYKALVNVATNEQPNLKYVVPGDPANSYLIQKLLGAAGITGGRMPLNGPYLDDATIAQVAAWIATGAAND